MPACAFAARFAVDVDIAAAERAVAVVTPAA